MLCARAEKTEWAHAPGGRSLCVGSGKLTSSTLGRTRQCSNKLDIALAAPSVLWGNAPMCLERRGNKKGVLLLQHSPNQVRE